jgi:glycosyltransferase involved in cell wall biosynthesis
MNLCIVTHSYPRFEADPEVKASVFIPQFASRLIEAGHRVHVFTPYIQGAKQDIGAIKVKWYRWLGSDKCLRYFNLFHPRDVGALISILYQGMRQLLPYVEQNRIQRILALWAVPGGYLARRAMKKLGIPYDVWLLGTDMYVWAKQLLPRQIIKKVLKDAQGCFSDGFEMMDMATDLAGRECRFLPTSRSLPSMDAVPCLMDSEYSNLLFVGRLSPEKGVQVLLEAMRIILAQGHKFRLYVIGSGVMEKWLSEAIQNHDITNSIFCIGSVSLEQLIGYYRAADALIVPLLPGGGSIPLVLSEAMQMQLPVIISDSGDMSTLINKYNVGLLFRTGDARDLARQIVHFFEGKNINTQGMTELARLINLDRATSDYLTWLDQIFNISGKHG